MMFHYRLERKTEKLAMTERKGEHPTFLACQSSRADGPARETS